ncbi:MAG TPA: hypothetical protein VGJ60_12140 [Chloroflexota bacterium]|jgi:hypothetical protein
MVQGRRGTSLGLVTTLSLLVSLSAGVAHAEGPGTASDGQQFQNQSAATQSDFLGTFGPTCAQQEWVWQHSLAVDPDEFGGPAANDGQKFTDQDDDDVQLPFVALFGTHANAEWVAEHNAFTAHRVLLGSVAPVPCPPAKSVGPANVIGTTHLGDAIEAATDGNLAQTSELFAQFQVIWLAARPKLPTSLEDPVQTAVDAATNALTPPNGQPPEQSQYVAALRDLLRAVRTANATFARTGGQPAVGAAPAAPAAQASSAVVAGPAIKANNLGEAVDSATRGDLANTRKEFDEFQDDWAKVSDAWHATDDKTADAVDAAVSQLQAIIGEASQTPAQAQYLPVILNLQKLVQDANTAAR